MRPRGFATRRLRDDHQRPRNREVLDEQRSLGFVGEIEMKHKGGSDTKQGERSCGERKPPAHQEGRARAQFREDGAQPYDPPDKEAILLELVQRHQSEERAKIEAALNHADGEATKALAGIEKWATTVNADRPSSSMRDDGERDRDGDGLGAR